MTTLTSFPSITYPIGVYEIDFLIEDNASSIVITLTHTSWADGACLEAEILWDNISSGIVSLSGGTICDKTGSPTLIPIQTIIHFNIPIGSVNGKIRTTILQELTTDLTMESF